MKLLHLAIVTSLLCTGLMPADPVENNQATTLIGSAAPEIQLTTSTGRAVPSEKYASGKRVLAILALNMPEGKKLLKILEEIRGLYPEEQLKIVAVEINRKKTNIDSYQKEHKTLIPIYYGKNKELMMLYKMQYVPTLYVIDENNIIRDVLFKDSVTSLSNVHSSIKRTLNP